jgi:hypothetical protein
MGNGKEPETRRKFDRIVVVALAERAIFDTLSEVRDPAIKALESRASADYRVRLLEGFRYPWPAVSVYA